MKISKLINASVTSVIMMGALSVPTLLRAENLDQALIWAYEGNPDLIAARAGVRQSLEQANIANAAARPKLNFSTQYSRSGNDYAGSWQVNDQLVASLSASLTVYDGGRTGLATDAAMTRARATNLQLLASEQQVLLNTVSAYLNVLRDRAMVSSAQNNIKTLQTQLQSARVAYDTGAATITEVSQTEAAASQAQADLASVQASLAASEANYLALTGHQAGSLSPVQNLPKLPASLAEAQQIGNTSSPLILAAIENERASQYDLRRAESARMPQVDLNANASRSNQLDGNGFQDSSSVGVQVGVPLYAGGQIPAAVRQAQAALEARGAETTATRRQIQQNVANAWAQLQNASAAVNAMQQVVEAQKLADEGAQVEYEIGSLTVTDRLIAQQNLISARSNLLTTQYQRQFAVYQVLAAMGKLTVEGMGLNIPTINPVSQAAAPAAQSDEAKAVEQISGRWESTQ